MERKHFNQANCSIARSLDIVGDWWVPLILRECLYGNRRFEQIQRWLGIGRNMLTRRLTQLVQQKVLDRRPYQDRPPRFEYHLTDKGYDAARLLLAMLPFGEKWMFDDPAEPVRFYDRRTDQKIRPVLVDAETGKPIDVRNVYPGPGPAYPADEEIRRRRFVDFYERRKEPSLVT